MTDHRQTQRDGEIRGTGQRETEAPDLYFVVQRCHGPEIARPLSFTARCDCEERSLSRPETYVGRVAERDITVIG